MRNSAHQIQAILTQFLIFSSQLKILENPNPNERLEKLDPTPPIELQKLVQKSNS